MNNEAFMAGVTDAMEKDAGLRQAGKAALQFFKRAPKKKPMDVKITRFSSKGTPAPKPPKNPKTKKKTTPEHVYLPPTPAAGGGGAGGYLAAGGLGLAGGAGAMHAMRKRR